VLAIDAAWSMLELAGEYAPSAWRVQADLSALPVRARSLDAAWARHSYVHLSQRDTPAALAELHRATAVGAPIALFVFGGDMEHGEFHDDEFAGRRFCLWPDDRLCDVVIGAGFAIERFDRDDDGKVVSLRLRLRRQRTLPDYVASGMRVLVVGLNPSLYAADAGVGFARPGNRFWPAALAAGLVTRDRDPRHALHAHGVGMTDLVKRATARADELTVDEYRDGYARLVRLVEWLEPRVVCVVGLSGWRAAIDRRADVGRQPAGIGRAEVYLMPSTSGANARVPLTELTEHLRSAAELAG
jgi:TDG/mug DNA glycosylase family protein